MRFKKSRTTLPTTTAALASAMLLAATLPVLADDQSATVSDRERRQHEATGLATGMIIGGAVGGPIGAIVTGAVGGWIGDLTADRKDKTLLADALADSRQALLAQQAAFSAMEQRYQLALEELQAAQFRNASLAAQPAVTQTGNTELALHFKTGSSQVEGLYDEQLTGFVSVAKGLPNAIIGITGHADRRGESAANLALSQRRIQAVEQKLRGMGLRGVTVQTNAYGENRPLSDGDTLENNFFDRRVVVKLIAPNGYITRQ